MAIRVLKNRAEHILHVTKNLQDQQKKPRARETPRFFLISTDNYVTLRVI